MRTNLWSLITGIVLAATCAQATVTLRFSQAFTEGKGIASGFSNRVGTEGVNGLKWGIIVDTAGNGFAGSGLSYFGMSAGPDTAAFLSVNGTTNTDDYFIPAYSATLPNFVLERAVTTDFSAQSEGTAGTISGGKGTIEEMVATYGVQGVTAGDAFAIVWFDSNSTASGEYYGFFTHANFQIPVDGSTSDYDAPFVGADTVRNANRQFYTVGPQEISVFAEAIELADNNGFVNFGTVNAGSSSSVQTFTLKNTGTGMLSDIVVSKAALGNPGDFVLDVSSLATTLEPTEETTFTVTFSPSVGGARSAVVEIASNDANENPFEVHVAGVSAGLALNSGLAVSPDDPATAQTVLGGSLVKYSVSAAASGNASDQVVVWVPVPVSSNVGFPVSPTNITNGGLYTAEGTTVSDANVPANSVYWVLGTLAAVDAPRVLQFDIGLSASVPDGTTYTTAVSARTNTQPSVQDTSLVLTIGTPNLPPHNGTINATPQTVAAKTRVTVNFSAWSDPENNVPLSYGVRHLGLENVETVVVADGSAASVLFDLPKEPVTYTYVARIKDSLGHVTLRPFMVAVPEIAVLDPENANIADDGSFNFGNVGVNVGQSYTFTIKNNGAGNLTGLAITKDFTNAAMFTISSSPVAPVLPGGTTTFTVRFTPTSAGAKVAKIHITSNDADESPFDITLIGGGAAASLPVVVTQAASLITPGGATLSGTVNAMGSERDITFEYGTTTKYGESVAANPETLSSSTVTPVSAVLTGLKAHTKYNFRVKATGGLGSATGANQFFTTDNTAPVAVADSFSTVPGIKMALPVLTNDTDADNDTLTISSFTPLSLPAAGTLVKTGKVLFFTAAASFVGEATATFTYTIGDGFGKTATATVTLRAAAFSITPLQLSLPSKADSYTIAVDDTENANGLWSVTESLAWATVSPTSGVGDGTVTVTLLANATKIQRKGDIIIAGITHKITQEAVIKPTLELPASNLLTAIVGDPYSLAIPTFGAPVTYKVTGLPAGLKLDNATGIISGTPTKGSLTPYSVTVSASNAAGPLASDIEGKAAATITFNLNVQPIPAGVVGVFHGFIGRDVDLNDNLGSRFELTTTDQGSYSGKIITGATTLALKGKLKTYPANPNSPTVELEILPKGKPKLILNLEFVAGDNAIDGTLEDEASHERTFSAWRNVWSKSDLATEYTMLHTFRIEQPIANITLPQGYGFGSFAVKDTTGAVTISGKLADSSSFTTTTFLGPRGQILVYQPLYTNRGSFAGAVNLDEDNVVSITDGDSVSWYKPGPVDPAKSKDTVYEDGFGPLELIVEGAIYTPPAKGKVVMNLLNEADNALLDFIGGELPNDGFDITFDLLNASATSTTNKATLPTGLENPNSVKLPTVTTATGLFSGEFTTPASPIMIARKVAFQGVVVQGSEGAQGYGYFLLPELPPTGGKLADMPKHSGKVELVGQKFVPVP